METDLIDLCAWLRERPYPGRGILLGAAEKGGGRVCSVAAYFLMGRSENSRNRVLEETEDGVRTRAKDESRLTDPSLVIYAPVRRCGTDLIVANGDQSDTIRDFLLRGGSFADALRTRTFEPDAPYFTPRISGVVHGDGRYELSILKEQDGLCRRFFFEYDGPRAGTGHFISTYQGYGTPKPSFAGEPLTAALPFADARALADALWDSLDADNRVALFARFTDLRDGSAETVLIDRFGGRVHSGTECAGRIGS